MTPFMEERQGMVNLMQRREFLKLAGFGGVVFASSLAGFPRRATADTSVVTVDTQDFHFVQMSDSHWGYEGPNNPDMQVTLPKAVEAAKKLSPQPDSIVSPGDLTPPTD